MSYSRLRSEWRLLDFATKLLNCFSIFFDNLQRMQKIEPIGAKTTESIFFCTFLFFGSLNF